MIIALVAIVLILVYIFYYWHSVSYPEYKPFIGKEYKESDFPIDFERAEELAYQFIEKYTGFNRSQLKLIRIHGYYSRIEIKEGHISLSFNITNSRYKGVIYIDIQSSTGRLSSLYVHLENYINLCRAVPGDNAKEKVVSLLRELGYLVNNDIDVAISHAINLVAERAILYDIVVYGHKVLEEGGFNGWDAVGGIIGICRLGDRIIYREIYVPDQVFRLYELGLFAKVYNPPIPGGEAYSRAIDYLNNKVKAKSIYEYRYKGVYWLILRDRSIKSDIYYQPIPRLAYRFYFQVETPEGLRDYDIFVDGITGEILRVV